MDFSIPQFQRGVGWLLNNVLSQPLLPPAAALASTVARAVGH